MAVKTSRGTEYVGLTVDTDSTYMGDCDNNYFAIVFDPDSEDFITVGHSYSPVHATIDAPEDIMEAYRLKKEAEQAKARAIAALNAVNDRIRNEWIESVTPSRGKRVKVVKGRKVPLGTEGTVKVHCESTYGYRTSMRVLLVTDDGTEHWTDARNVEVISVDQTVGSV